MAELGTVFYLIATNSHADRIVLDSANRERRYVDPNNQSKLCLRVGTDQPSNFPGNLVRFGQFRGSSDVILGRGWSKDDQCYFVINPHTKELELRDISSRSNTRLLKGGKDLLGGNPRMCWVPRSPSLTFAIGCAEFVLEQSITESGEWIEAFPNLPVFESYDMTYEDTATLLRRECGLQPYRYLPRRDEDIEFWVHKHLGRGGQGEVYEVVDRRTGENYACKTIAIKGPIAKAKIMVEVDIVKTVSHKHIVEYLHYQGLDSERAEIFMPVYKGSLKDLLEQLRPRGEAEVRKMANEMFYQMLLALNHINEFRIIHRDIKPQNILFSNNRFFLSDFGLAEHIDKAKGNFGTHIYAAPEVWLEECLTVKVDIYALGVTYIECLQEFNFNDERRDKYPDWESWHQHLQGLVAQYAPHIKTVFADNPDHRPTARELLTKLFPETACSLPSLVSSPPTNQGADRPIDTADSRSQGSLGITAASWSQGSSMGTAE